MNRYLILRLLGVATALAAMFGCDAVHERIHMSKGNRMYNAQKFEAAAVEYRGAIEVQPTAFEPNYRLASAYLSLVQGGTLAKDYAAEARRTLERCLELDVPDEATRQNIQDQLVGLLMAGEDWDGAIALMERRIEREPTNLGLVEKLAGVYSKRGDFPRALHYLELRTELDPGSAQTWHTISVLCWDRSYRGGSFVSRGERERLVTQGLAAVQHALDLRPDWPDSLIYYNLLLRERAKVHQVAGRNAEAVRDTAQAEEYLKRALALRSKATAAKI